MSEWVLLAVVIVAALGAGFLGGVEFAARKFGTRMGDMVISGDMPEDLAYRIAHFGESAKDRRGE